MGSNRNMDELIKRQLDDLEIEPSKLTFNKVQKAYLSQKAGGNAGGSSLRWALVAVLMLTLLAGAFFINLSSPKTVAEKNKNNSSTFNESNTTSMPSEPVPNSTNTEKFNAPPTNSSSTPVTLSTTEKPMESNATLAKDNTVKESSTAAPSPLRLNAKTTVSKTSDFTNENNLSSPQKINDLTVSTTKKTSSTKSKSRFGKTPPANKSGNTNEGMASLNAAASKAEVEPNGAVENSKTLTESPTLTAAGNLTPSGNTALLNATPPQHLMLNAAPETDNNETKMSYYLPMRTAFASVKTPLRELEKPTLAYNDSLARMDRYKDYYRKRINPYYITISSEMQINQIEQVITTNKNVRVGVDLPQFNDKPYNEVLAESISASTQFNLGGSFLLGFHYRNFGLESGIRFFGFENTIYLKHIPNAYYNRQFMGLVYDSLGNMTDSAFQTTSIRYPFLVNGDSISPTKYLSAYRFTCIPIRATYAFRMLRSKLIIEPSLGVQLCLPMASNNLVHEGPYKFTYQKSKQALAPFIQYDGALKIQYQLSRSAGIYVRQGYALGTQSIYAANYPVKLSVNALYTGVGINITLRK